MKAYGYSAIVSIISIALITILISSMSSARVFARASEPVAPSNLSYQMVDDSSMPMEAAIDVTKTVALDPLSCSPVSEIQVSPGANVYFCITIENTGTISLTQHLVSDSLLGGPVPISYILRAGEIISLTNAVLQDIGMPTVLGPIPVEAGTLTNTVTIVSSNPAIEGAVATGTAEAKVNAIPTAIDDIDEPTKPHSKSRLLVPFVRQ